MTRPDLLLIRHAKAEAVSPSGMDRDRPLTAQGMDDAIRLAGIVERIVPTDAVIVASPFVRTMQTAGAIASRSGATVIEEALLEVGRSVEDHLDVIRTFIGRPTIIVGHMPTIGETAASIMGTPDVALHVRPGTIMAFTWRSQLRTLATLELFLPPFVVRD
jgi:phosphohistidine phosphatase